MSNQYTMIKYTDNEIKKIISLYKNGMSFTKISKILHRKKNNIKKILIENNVFIDDRDKIKFEITEKIGNDIISLYNNGKSCEIIGKKYSISKGPINNFLKEKGILRKGYSNGIKIYLNKEQKNQIKEFYLNEHKTNEEISKLLNLNKHFIDKYLSKCDYRRTISESVSIRQRGKKRSDRVKKILSIAQQKFSKSGKRKQTGGVCKTFVVNGLKCQGTYEKFYIEFLLKNNIQLPSNGNFIITPFGVYTPDFEYSDKLIEIKSEYTYSILIGEKPSRWTNKIDTTQYEKIKWVNENVKSVDIFVVDKFKNKIIKK